MSTAARNKAAPKTPAAIAGANTLTLRRQSGKSEARTMAELGLSAVASNVITARTFANGNFGLLDLTETLAVMAEKAARVQAGDLSEVETTLTAQAIALDSIFNELARRAALNMGEHLPATEIYLRHALKAQAQCRCTLETLAEIKNPRSVAFVKQANIASGPQQVNNCTQAREAGARAEKRIDSNEQTGGSHELLTDARTPQVTSRIDTPMEAVGASNRPAD